jgi:hypothetical protein
MEELRYESESMGHVQWYYLSVARANGFWTFYRADVRSSWTAMHSTNVGYLPIESMTLALMAIEVYLSTSSTRLWWRSFDQISQH